ncbi:MAG: O-antigen ligase family protein [Nitrospirales bacterium]|nr:O-antigen ligase family protein [Nitrospira sp.]MDR4502674.1 O-antigen ligase family protein [Nitrospirales bacterium]
MYLIIIFPLVISLILGLLVLSGSLPIIVGGGIVLPIMLGLLIYCFPAILDNVKAVWRQLQWWHILWLLAFFSGFVFRVREAGLARENPLDIWALYRIVLMGLVGVILIYQLVLKRSEWLSGMFYGLVGVFGIAAIWNLASTVWSVYPAWTFYKSAEYFLDVSLLAAILSTVKTPEEFKSFLDWTWMLLAFLAGTIFLGVLLWPEESIKKDIGMFGARLIGVFPAVSANGVGDLGAILGCVSFARLLLRKSSRLFFSMLFVISMILLLASQTRSSLGGFILGAFLIMVLTKRLGVIFIIPIGFVVGLLSTDIEQVLLQYVLRGQDTELLLSGTGRVGWWEYAWERFIEQPFSGYGAYAAGRFAVLQQAGLQETSTLHSSWLETLLGVGIFGVILLLLVLISTWVVLLQVVFSLSHHTLGYHLAIESLGVLSVLSVRSFFDSLLIWHPALPFLAIVGLAEMLRRQQNGVFHENFARP